LRYGQAGEKYVFNSAGQEIELEGLICACGGAAEPAGAPLGNPVKDSMAGKLKAETDEVLGVIYASADCDAGRAMAAHAQRFGVLLKDFGGAREVQTSCIQGG